MYLFRLMTRIISPFNTTSNKIVNILITYLSPKLYSILLGVMLEEFLLDLQMLIPLKKSSMLEAWGVKF